MVCDRLAVRCAAEKIQRLIEGRGHSYGGGVIVAELYVGYAGRCGKVDLPRHAGEDQLCMRKWVGEGREECGARTLVCCGHGGLKAAGMGVSVWVASAIDSPRRSPVCVRTAARSSLE